MLLEIEKEFKGNVGLFLVCVELSKRNLIAMPTSRNTKGIDLVVLNPETNKSLGIQVKCTDKKDFPILTTNWYNYEAKINEKIVAPFIFVDISDINNPKYYILSENEIKNEVKTIIKAYIDNQCNKKNMTPENLFEWERSKKRKPDLWAIKSDMISRYEGKWETIINYLN